MCRRLVGKGGHHLHGRQDFARCRVEDELLAEACRCLGSTDGLARATERVGSLPEQLHSGDLCHRIEHRRPKGGRCTDQVLGNQHWAGLVC